MSDRRLIHSLGGLMAQFGVELMAKPAFPKARYEELKAQGFTLKYITPKLREEGYFPRIGGIEVCGVSRTNLWPLMADSEVEYVVTGHNEKALFKGESLNQMLRDFVHAAECGCSGCKHRVDQRYELYKERCAASAEQTPEPQG